MVTNVARTRVTIMPPEVLFQGGIPRWKRVLDVTGALTACVVFAPAILFAACLIRLTSPGPILFLQERVGYMGRKFTIIKFRTMHASVETAAHKVHVVSLIQQDSNSSSHIEARPMTKLANDTRIIPGGNFLRKSHIDELPQLWNVLRGEMSLVGPRPPIEYEVEAYSQWHTARFDAVPGMTGLWQVSGKNDTTFRDMVRFDIRYARERSLMLDIRILFSTCLVVADQILRRSAKERKKTERVFQSS